LNIKYSNSETLLPSLPFYLNQILLSKNGTASIYKVFIENSHSPTCKIKWNNFFHIENNEWNYLFEWVHLLTKDSYLQWLQTRITHRILATNYLLFKMNLVSSDKCTFCKEEKETLLHLFWNCSHTKSFILDVQQFLKKHDIDWNFDCKSFILGYQKPCQGQLNIFCLETKRFIFMCKRRETKPTLQGLRNSLKLASSITKYTNSKKSMYSLVDRIVNL